MAVIEMDSLTKYYGDTVGVESLTMDVEEGEIFGFLGPNGAGKTTTIRLLLGLLRPTAGSARVLSAPIDDEQSLTEAKRKTGYLPDELGFPEKVTGQELIDHHASIKGASRLDDMLDLFEPPLDRQIRAYSGGNKQMLGIILTFMHDPSLVILDEPTGGLDPLKQARFHEFIRAERDRGVSVFFSSHILSEVRRICDRVGILRGGELVELAEIESMLRRGGKRVIIEYETDGPDPTAWDDVHNLERVGDAYQFMYTGSYTSLLNRLAGAEVVDVTIEEPPLEDVFMHYYGEESYA